MVFADLSKFLNPQPERVELRHPVTGELIGVLHSKGGVAHREDGPAHMWFQDGKMWAQEWYVNGQAHRENGPAKMYLKHPQPRGKEAIAANGERIAEWHMNGEYVGQGILDHKTFHTHWHKGD